MHILQSWIADFVSQHKAWLGPTVKISLALAVAWLLHGSLSRVNPRWRRLVWRATAVGCTLITVSAIFPPPLAWHVLPPPAIESVADDPPASDPVKRATSIEPIVAFVPAPVEPATPESFTPPYDPGEYYPVAPLVVSSDHPLAASSAAEPASAALVTAPAAPLAASPAPVAVLAEPVPVAPLVAEVPDRSLAERAAALVSNWRLWLAIWMVGAVWKLLDTLLGMRKLQGICRRGTAAPAWIAKRCHDMAAELGCAQTPQVVASDEIGSPCIMGVWQPVILLPRLQCEKKFEHELPAILFHELAHLRGQDVAWQLFVHALGIVWWFHPLAWRIRLAHASACDAVCDSVAAHHLGDAIAYGRILARLTIRILRLRSASGMAMSQGSSIRHRIEALDRRIFPASLARGPALCAVLVIVSLSALIGGITLARASSNATAPLEEIAADPGSADETVPADEAPAANVLLALGKAHDSSAAPLSQPPTDLAPDVGKPSVIAAPPDDYGLPAAGMGLAVQDDGGRPVPEANIHFRSQINGEWLERDVTTDVDGQARFSMKRGPKLTFLWLTCSKPGLVPVHYFWRGNTHPIELPAELTLRLEPGTPVTGLVLDENGQPIIGADVAVHMPITWPKLANWVFCAANLKTNAQGRWHWDAAPPDLANVNVAVSHASYLRGHGRFAERENRATLTQGLKIAGRVTDETGEPLAGATARAGFDRFGTGAPEARTDDEGRFVLRGCKAGQSLVTIQADGFAPQVQEVAVGQTTSDVDFRLEPGRVMRLRVVDAAGKPIRGACFFADTWRGYRSLDVRLQTDAEGRVYWNSAPMDTVLCDFCQSGCMSVRKLPLQAGRDETVVTMPGELVIRGKVTDAQTGRAISQFGIRNGQLLDGSDEARWSNDEPTPCEDGLYRLAYSEPCQGRILEFVAPGYLPAKSRVFESSEGKQTFNIQLQRGSGLRGTVLLADGLPAIGAEVALATEKSQAYLAGGHFHRQANSAPIVNTDEHGEFILAPRESNEPSLLIVVHDAGIAQIGGDELAKSSEIKLQPWGRIEGRAMLGERPDADRQVSFWPKQVKTEQFVSNWDYQAQTDTDGRFVIDRVVPGDGNASRMVVTQFASGWQNAPGWQVAVDVPAGGTAAVDIGGTGRMVVGKVVLDRQPATLTDWTINQPAMLNLEDETTGERSGYRVAANIDAAGNFAIPDVPAGNFTLSIPVNAVPKPNVCGAGDVIGRAMVKVVVPPPADGLSDGRLDVGTITAPLFDTLRPSEAAPDFALNDLAGGTVRLSDIRGKLVVLSFWATWNRPSLAEMSRLAAVHNRFAADPRFVMIGLASNQRIEPVRAYVERNQPAWIQLHAGGPGSRLGTVAESYGVRELPAIFLIGPDGRVLAKDLAATELDEAIMAVLTGEGSFVDPPAVASAPGFLDVE